MDTIINSFDFNKEVSSQNATSFMGSLDVDALFTSIPLEKTINIAVNEFFHDKTKINKLSKQMSKIFLI